MKASDFTDQQIDDYLLGRMSAADRTAFESQLAKDEQLKIAVEEQEKVHGGIEAFVQADVKSKLKNFHQELPTPAPALSRPRQNYRWLAAAAILLLLAMTFLFLPDSKTSPQELYAQYFEPYPMQLANRSDNNNEWLLILENQYAQQNYTKALQLLNAHPEAVNQEKKLQLYTGICLLETNQLEQALSYFNQLQPTDPIYGYEGHWYAALAYLKGGEAGRAKEKLQLVLQKENGDYEASAKQLLELLAD